ncbi:hypothetical protein [Blastococcus saxobsidens]|uniref:Uncharacterized protein n=1 Tax=Blastococcus saxobsidens (strain DD2) TaxID=1146883 RepID=H6RVX7_BLASD|nr:hypothetical protein [Blastococcus saxobsidens]CCG05807.1 conserved protein of unknown function [Blastococcus saxobsidens DD2]
MSSSTRLFRRSTPTSRRSRLVSVPVTGAAALALVLTGCGDEEAAVDDGAAVVEEETDVLEDDTAAEETDAMADEDAAAADPAAGEPGTLLAGDASVFDALGAADPAAELEPLASEPVTATLVPVLAVPADEGFWIGTETERIWVQLTEAGESPININPDDLVSFTAELVPNADGFVEQLGLPEEQATALTELGYHLEVPAGDVAMG